MSSTVFGTDMATLRCSLPPWQPVERFAPSVTAISCGGPEVTEVDQRLSPPEWAVGPPRAMAKAGRSLYVSCSRALSRQGACGMMTRRVGAKRALHEGVRAVPLSEDEERILQDIEREFYENDPAIAKELGETTLYRHAWRNIKLSLLAFFLGLVILVWFLSGSYLVSFAGFLVMLGAALVIERNARNMGKAGIQSMTNRLKDGSNLREYLGNSSDKMRKRLKRDED